MSSKRWWISGLSLLVVFVVIISASQPIIASPQSQIAITPIPVTIVPITPIITAVPTATRTPTAVTQTYLNFSAKFVCGYQPQFDAAGHIEPGEPPVKPGNYATEINIHNYNYSNSALRKKVLLLVEQGRVVGREPEQVKPRAFDSIVLGPDGATLDDCNRIWQLLYPGVVPPTPMPLMIGYLVVISKVDLDVDVVYTAAVPGDLHNLPSGISMDVERVAGKRVAIPATLFPGGPLPADQ